MRVIIYSTILMKALLVEIYRNPASQEIVFASDVDNLIIGEKSINAHKTSDNFKAKVPKSDVSRFYQILSFLQEQPITFEITNSQIILREAII